MLTIHELQTAGMLTPWQTEGHRLPMRAFLFTANWFEEFSRLPSGVGEKGKLAGWSSPGDRLAALIERFVRGEPTVKLIRPQGEGMHPVFKRMRPPHRAVVELRTRQTRTFGFFSRRDVFVATSVGLADEIKANRLYIAHAKMAQRLIARLAASEFEGERDVSELVTD